MELRLQVDILLYLCKLNHRLVDTQAQGVLGLGLASQVLGIGLDLDG